MYVPIVMYGLRLFIVVLQELQCLPNCLHIIIIRYVQHQHSSVNIVYRTVNIILSLRKLFIPLSLQVLFKFLKELNVLPEAISCCLLQCLLLLLWCVHLKSMHIPSFVWIGCCVSELLCSRMSLS